MAIRKIVARSIGVDVITAEDLADNSITAAEITNGAVTADKLASNSVTTAKLATTLTVTHELGSASTPSITFTGDTNTGIFSPAADTIAFAEGGAEIARFDSSANLLLGTTTTPSGISNSLTFADGTFQKSSNITVGSLTEYNANTSLPTTVFGRLITSNTTNATTLTLPSLSGQSGKVVSISNINTGPVTVITGSSNGAIFGMGLNGGNTIYVPAYSSIQLSNDGGNWKALTSNTVSATTGTAPYYAARAWVNFGGGYGSTGGAINGSANVTSVTDNGTGDFTVNFTVAMPDTNYATVAGCREDTASVTYTSNRVVNPRRASGTITTTSVRIGIADFGYAANDVESVFVTIFR
jgi:hypothetical protein